jgi:hypothetical protein
LIAQGGGLVGTGDVARLYGVTPSAITNRVKRGGKRAGPLLELPDPLIVTASGPLWLRSELCPVRDPDAH